MMSARARAVTAFLLCTACGSSADVGSSAGSGAAGGGGNAGASTTAGSAGMTSAGVGPGPTGGAGYGGSAGSGGTPGPSAGASAIAGTSGAASGGSGGVGAKKLHHVFVIALENHDEDAIIGNVKDAPYLNGLLQQGTSASAFMDELPKSIVSEPHYVWMEAGTNVFADHTFDGDNAPSDSNSTAEVQHLSTELDTAKISWMSYQQGLNATTGACPIVSDGAYAPKHDPFVFFRDVSGSPPAKDNARCAAHHEPMSQLAADLKGDMPAYAFITPDLCNDMHGAAGCPDSNTIHAGDAWLSANVPALLDYAKQHDGVLFITWDEGENTLTLPFLALGPTVKAGYVSPVTYTHSSLLKTVEQILGVPVLPRVKDAADFSDMFAQAPY